MSVFIYILSDPRTNEIRYVGKAIDTKKRLSVHLCDRKKSHKTNWIQSLLKEGAKPEMEIVETFFDSDDEDWKKAERWWISYLRFIGCRLTNLDNGGGGAGVVSAATREKMRAASRGKSQTPESRVKIGAAHKGKIVSAETRAKISAANRGKTMSEENRAKQSAARKGQIPSPQTLAAARAARIGSKHSADARAKMRRAHFERNAKKRESANV